MIRRMLFVLIFSLLAACGAIPAGAEQLPGLEGNWSITFTQSGGFVGVHRTVTITSDGKVAALDEREDRAGTIQLTEAELAELEAQISAARLNRPAEADSGCADCFIYDLQIDSGNARFIVQLDDVTLPESGLQPLIQYLLDLMEQALSSQ